MRIRFNPLRATATTIVVAVAIQLVPVHRTNPPVTFEVEAPSDVMPILERACYDCHSNRTRWPWYSRVAPVSWLVARDVRRGREDLNFSEWPAFDFEAQEHSLSDIVKQIRHDKMPLPAYRWMHPEARLTDEDKQKLLEWAQGP